MNKCDKNIHYELIKMIQDICPFCGILLIKGDNKKAECCIDKNIKNIDGYNICINCGLTDNVEYHPAFIDFYENIHNIVKKSYYIRKYHITNVINNLSFKNGVELTCRQRDKIFKIFHLIDLILNYLNENRKRIINVKFLLHKIFEMMDIKYNIYVKKSNKTHYFYNNYWKKIISLIGNDIEYILCK